MCYNKHIKHKHGEDLYVWAQKLLHLRDEALFSNYGINIEIKHANDYWSKEKLTDVILNMSLPLAESHGLDIDEVEYKKEGSDYFERH